MHNEIEPGHSISDKIACASSEDMISLRIRFRSLATYTVLCEDRVQTARTRRLI